MLKKMSTDFLASGTFLLQCRDRPALPQKFCDVFFKTFQPNLLEWF